MDHYYIIKQFLGFWINVKKDGLCRQQSRRHNVARFARWGRRGGGRLGVKTDADVHDYNVGVVDDDGDLGAARSNRFAAVVGRNDVERELGGRLAVQSPETVSQVINYAPVGFQHTYHGWKVSCSGKISCWSKCNVLLPTAVLPHKSIWSTNGKPIITMLSRLDSFFKIQLNNALWAVNT